MAKHMLLDTEDDYDFDVVAICSSEPEHSMAFHINKHLNLSLVKRKGELSDFDSRLKREFKFSVYETKEPYKGVEFLLLANKSWEENTLKSEPSFGDLFANEQLDNTVHLIPNQKKTDFFLLVYDCDDLDLLLGLLYKLKRIPQIITSYQVDMENMKSKEKLLDIRDSYE